MLLCENNIISKNKRLKKITLGILGAGKRKWMFEKEADEGGDILSMVILIMGVSGCGKTTIGLKAARALQVPFLDGDDLHLQTNISKMNRGLPLTDDDRGPWLKRVAEEMAKMAGQGGGVVACSALKKSYRQVLFGDSSIPILLVYLKGTRDTLYRRLQQRKSHFMPPDLLNSQLNTLEEPEHALTLSIELSPEILCKRIVHDAAA